jgi:hypothetical protein
LIETGLPEVLLLFYRISKSFLKKIFFQKRRRYIFEVISKVIQKMAKMASQRTAKGSLKLLPAG